MALNFFFANKQYNMLCSLINCTIPHLVNISHAGSNVPRMWMKLTLTTYDGHKLLHSCVDAIAYKSVS